MGFIPEPTPEMGEYSTEVRSTSFYLRANGRPVYLYCDPYKTVDHKIVEEALKFADLHRASTSFRVKDALTQDFLEKVEKAVDHGRTGTVELLIEDIPKIRALLDQVEAHQ